MRNKRRVLLTLTLLLTLFCATTIYAQSKSGVKYDKYGDVRYNYSISLHKGISWWDTVQYNVRVSGSDAEFLSYLYAKVRNMDGKTIADKKMAGWSGLKCSSWSGKKTVWMAYGADIEVDLEDGRFGYLYVSY